MSRVIPAFSQFFGSDGEPLANGWLRFLISGTNNTAKNTYADADQMIPNPNPLQLDGEGRCPNCFGQGIYRVVLFENNVVLHQPGELIQMFDPVVADYLPEGAGGNFAEWDSDVIYQIGQIILFNERYYRSVTANNLGNQPDIHTEDWEQIDFLRFWNLDVVYSENDVVIYGSQLFTSIMDANLNHNPASSPAWWYTVGPNQILYDTFVISEDQWRTSDAAGTSVILGADITLTADFSPISPVNINGHQVDGPFNLDFSNCQPSSLTENCFGPDLTVLGLEGEVFAEYWEAIGDGITVDTLAFQKAGATGLPVHLKSSKRYLIDGTVNGFAFISESHGNQLDNGTGNPESAFVLNAGAALTINKRGGYIRGICFYANADNIAMIHVTRKHVLIDHVKFFNNPSLHTNVTGIRIGNTDAGETCPYFNLTNFVAFSMKYFLDFWGTSQCNAIHISNGGVTSYISGSSFIRYAATANCQRGAVKNVYVEHFTNILEVNAQYFNTNFLEINNDANDYFLYNTSATDAYQGITNIDTQPAINWINPASTKGIYYSNYIKGPDAEFFPIGINAMTRRGQTGGIKRATFQLNNKRITFSDTPYTWDFVNFPSIEANASSGPIIINIPVMAAQSASSMVLGDWAGLRLFVVKTDNSINTVTINFGTQFVNSAQSYVLGVQWENLVIQCDASSNHIIVSFSIASFASSESQARYLSTKGRSIILTNNITLTSDFTPAVPINTNGYQIDGAYTLSFATAQPSALTRNCFGSTLTVSNLKQARPEYWGIIGDGVADDGAKFNSITAMLKTFGGEIDISNLIIGTSVPIELRSGVKIKGGARNRGSVTYLGVGAQFKALSTMTSVIRAVSDGTPTPIEECYLSGVFINGNNNADYGLFLRGCKRSHFSDLYIAGAKTNQLIIYAETGGYGVFFNQFDHVKVNHGSADWAVVILSVTSTPEANGNLFDNLEVYGNGGTSTGIYMSYALANTFINPTVQNCKYGWYFYQGVKNLNIFGGYAESNATATFRVNGQTNAHGFWNIIGYDSADTTEWEWFGGVEFSGFAFGYFHASINGASGLRLLRGGYRLENINRLTFNSGAAEDADFSNYGIKRLKGIASGSTASANLSGENAISAGNTSVTVTLANTEADASYKIILSPVGDNPGGFAWVSGRTQTQFVINLSVAAGAGGRSFSWMLYR